MAVLQRLLPDCTVESRAVTDYGTNPAKKTVRDFALAKGYNLEGHRSRVLTQEDVDTHDHLLFVDKGVGRLMMVFKGIKPKMVYIGRYYGPQGIPDPNFLKGVEFIDVMNRIHETAELFAKGWNSART